MRLMANNPPYTSNSNPTGATAIPRSTNVNPYDVNNHGSRVDHALLADSASAVAWANITGAPATFPAAAHTHAASEIVSGTMADARIAESNVTQHEAALSLALSQVNAGLTFTTSLIKVNSAGAMSVFSGQPYGSVHMDPAGTAIETTKNNHAATAAPTVNDDSLQAYTVGSRWLDLTNDKEYVCLDSTLGAAVWVETTAAGGGAHASNHITGGSDEIDGDKLDIDWTPSNYTPSTTPTEADNINNLTAHLYGLDQAIANSSEWDTAYSWGDHSGQGYITASSSDALTNKTFSDHVLPTADLSKDIGSVTKRWLNCWIEQNTFVEGSPPATPPAGHVTLYAKTDGKVYIKDDTGTETDLTASGSALDIPSYSAMGTTNDADTLVIYDASAAGHYEVTLLQLLSHTHAHAASEVVSGTFADARISASSVTQHEAALSVDASQLVVTNNFDYGEYNVYANVFGATLDNTTYADLSSSEWEFYVGGLAVLHLDSAQDATFYGNIAGPTTQVSSHHILDHTTTPTAPILGTSHLYAKSDGELYFYAYGGSEQVTNQTGGGGGGGGSGVSPQPIQLDSGAWYAPVTNGAAPGFVELATNDVALPTFDFDDSTQEYVQCRLKVPADWDGNDITVKIEWTVATTPSGTGTDAVKWNLQTLPLANDEQMDAAWSTADTVTDTANTTAGANKIYETAAFTVAAADVGAAGEMLFLRLSRHAGDAADEIVGDVKFISATFFFGYA